MADEFKELTDAVRKLTVVVTKLTAAIEGLSLLTLNSEKKPLNLEVRSEASSAAERPKDRFDHANEDFARSLAEADKRIAADRAKRGA